MSTPQDMEIRRAWAELYAKTAIQSYNLSRMILDESLREDTQKARQFGYLVMTFGADIEDLLSKLYDLASITYQVTQQDFMHMGGFRALNQNREHHHNHPEEG